MGSCSGGFLSSVPNSSQTSKAVNCSVKKGLWRYSLGSFMIVCNWAKQWSDAKSQACHIGWLYVGGSRGVDIGVHLQDLIILSANKKFLNKLATRRSCLNSFWKISWGNTFQAMVSVIAVNIQFNSPRAVLLSAGLPGMRSIKSGVIPDIIVCEQNLNRYVIWKLDYIPF